MLCAGTFVVGLYNAFAQYLRFAAADVADVYAPSLRERAISWVLAGGLAGGIVGPEMSKLTREALPTTFAGTYLALSVVALIACLIASRLHIPQRRTRRRQRRGEAAARDRRAAGLHRRRAGGCDQLRRDEPADDGDAAGDEGLRLRLPAAADVIKWHVIAMFAPGFFTGALLRRFGRPAR